MQLLGRAGERPRPSVPDREPLEVGEAGEHDLRLGA
jgi:hypothetical protein